MASREKQYNVLKLRLYPTSEQAELFEKTFGCCRYLWNQMLADQQRFYLETGVHFIPTPAKYKKGAPFLKEVDNQALIQEHNQLSRAFRLFFQNPEAFGHPNFKRKKDDRDSFTACNHVFTSGPTIYTTRDGIRMTKAGMIRAVFPRRPQNGWKLKRVTVEKARTGRYYAYVLYESLVQPPEPVLPAPERTLGLKYSLRHFYVDDQGNRADPPRWLKQSQEKLVHLQRRLNRMGDDLGAMTDTLIQAGSTVKEAGFGMFREMLCYKLARQGKAFIQVDRDLPTTRSCSACGLTRDALHARDYRRSGWVCPECGAVHDREVNAAKNIKARGLEQFFDLQGQNRSA